MTASVKARARQLWWLLALPFLFLISGTYAMQVAQRITFRTAFLTNLALLGAALAVLLWASGSRFRLRRLLRDRRELAALLAILLAGAAMRTVYFGTFPPEDGQLIEEAQLAGAAVAGIEHGDLDSFFPFPTLTSEIGFRLLGVSMRALRVPFVALGIAAIPLFFVAARLLLRSAAAALFVTGLFATNAFLAGSSRIALESMSPVTTECLALAALFYACTRRTRPAFALAGFTSGVGVSEYFSVKLVAGLAARDLVVRALQTDDTRCADEPGGAFGLANLRRHGPALGLCLAFALLVAVPVLLSDRQNLGPVFEGYMRHRAALHERYGQMPLARIATDEAAQIARTAQFFFIGGEGSDILPPSMGLLDPVTGALGVLALLWCLITGWRRPVRWFLVLAAVLFVGLSAVLVGNPARYRLIPLIPYYLLAIGVLVDDLLALTGRHRRTALVLLAAVLGGLSAFNAQRIFAVAMHSKPVLLSFYSLNMVLGQEIDALQKLDPAATVYLLSDRDFLGQMNDFHFLYDLNRVKVVTTAAQLVGARGFLLSHSPFVGVARTVPGLQECRQWETALVGETVLACRLG